MKDTAPKTVCERPTSMDFSPQTEVTMFSLSHLVEAANHSVAEKFQHWQPDKPSMGQRILFESLPYDLHGQIAKYMDDSGMLRLRMTNKHLHERFDPRTIFSPQDLVALLTEGDSDEESKCRNLHICYRCCRLRYKTNFPHVPEIRQDSPRWCFDCLGETRSYKHLEPLSNGKVTYFTCHNCGSYGTKPEKCRGARVFGESCGEDFVAEQLALCTTKTPRPLARLEKLPIRLLKLVAKHLDYRDFLRLKQVSRTFNHILRPRATWIPIHKRLRLTKDQWAKSLESCLRLAPMREFEEMPCFACFRYRPRPSFSEEGIIALECNYAITSSRCFPCLVRLQNARAPTTFRTEYRRRRAV